jgi:hypothetical protein
MMKSAGLDRQQLLGQTQHGYVLIAQHAMHGALHRCASKAVKRRQTCVGACGRLHATCATADMLNTRQASFAAARAVQVRKTPHLQLFLKLRNVVQAAAAFVAPFEPRLMAAADNGSLPRFHIATPPAHPTASILLCTGRQATLLTCCCN